MSFYVNDTELKQAYFNGSEVNSIYYNNELVWESWSWPGWTDDLTWEDIYKLCKKKQSGEIADWPNDVVLGVGKMLTLSTSVLGGAKIPMYIIGIDQDGEGTLTFQSMGGLPTKTVWANDNDSWGNSQIRQYCQDIYNYCNAKPYIKTVRKGIVEKATSVGKRNGTATYYDDTVWIASDREMGLDSFSCLSVAYSNDTNAECTYGYNFSYDYNSSNANRIRYLLNSDGSLTTTKIRHWTRSVWYNISNFTYRDCVKVDGTNGCNQYNSTNEYLVPCFVIG